MNNQIPTFFCFLLFGILVLSACKNDRDVPKIKGKNSKTQISDKDYFSVIIGFDTLTSEDYKKAIYKEDSVLNAMGNTDGAYYHYFKARKFSLEKKRDSAVKAFQKMRGKTRNDNIELLKTYNILTQSFGDGLLVESRIMRRIISAMEVAEQVKSPIVYKFYDLLANAYFQNRNEKKSLKYSALYYENHPFKNHAVVKQRYYDISFLLASRIGDFPKMKFYNKKARKLAFEINDSIAIARSYNNESQIYAQQKQPKKALEYSKVYFNYLKSSNNLNDIAYNNLAASFMGNKQPDSAIKYYRMGIELENKSQFKKQKSLYYLGLTTAYKAKGDYIRAIEAADSAYTIEIRNNKEIEAVKIAELQEKYEMEKKDRSIAELNGRNKLNESYIKQQRWTLILLTVVFSCILVFLYSLYRQQHLKGKNKLLKSENQRLHIEQKLLQSQLDPHFIFNAIANLQSLISSGHVDEPVKYLNSFSSLLRGVLEQNRKDFIELNEEVKSLHNYIQLQQMRYDGVFDYQIIIDKELNPEQILIPPMLIQPFVENAIEHGFRDINYKGLLDISFTKQNLMLLIEVVDNGIGMINNVNNYPKKQSLAQVILKERLALLFRSSDQAAKFTVTDQNNFGSQGTRAKIVIPLIQE